MPVFRACSSACMVRKLAVTIPLVKGHRQPMSFVKDLVRTTLASSRCQVASSPHRTQNKPAGRQMPQLTLKVIQAARADLACTLHKPDTNVCCALSDRVTLKEGHCMS